jgi:hypothetical protein
VTSLGTRCEALAELLAASEQTTNGLQLGANGNCSVGANDTHCKCRESGGAVIGTTAHPYHASTLIAVYEPWQHTYQYSMVKEHAAALPEPIHSALLCAPRPHECKPVIAAAWRADARCTASTQLTAQQHTAKHAFVVACEAYQHR